MYSWLRPLLFRLPPETAHALTLAAIRLAGSVSPMCGLLRAWFAVPSKPVQAFGYNFANPVGLAAGYDKDGLGWRGLACLGFGHIEIGTVTPKAQAGNPKPRIFRLPEEAALINRMGFPGRGAEFVARQLVGKRPAGLILGVNIGKNKDTPLERSVEDYISLLRVFAPLADYLAVNVSSPNTVGLRKLQEREALEGLLKVLGEERAIQAQSLNRHVPLLVKIAPDLNDGELEDALEVIQVCGMDGVIATNTTISRQGIHSPLAEQSGGLSGAPLFARSLEMVSKIHAWTAGKLPIIGVGGVNSPSNAHKMLEAGAVLVQAYTGLVYSGPGLVKKIVRSLT